MATSLTEFGEQLRSQISAFSQTGKGDFLTDPGFDRLARSLFRLQFEANPVYRAWCESRGITPENLSGWQQIPLVPTAAFKEVDISCIEPGAASTCFHSSGTTGHRPSRHWHSPSSLAVYEDSLLGWFEPFLLKEETADLIVDLRESDGRWAMVSLTPPADTVPHSSLAHMMATLQRRFGTKDSLFVGTLDSRGDWVLDTDRLLFVLRRSLCGNRPLVLMGTAFNFVHFLDLAEQRNLRYRLAAGSRLMETGGYKGRSREMSPELLHSELGRRLGLPGSDVITEYGMCELSSQAYSHAAGTAPNRHFRFPPWARIRVVSPETGKEAGEGEIGTLAVYDLANAWSVLAVQTGDLAIRTGDSFQLMGRVPQSEPRGCSLLAARGTSPCPCTSLPCPIFSWRTFRPKRL